MTETNSKLFRSAYDMATHQYVSLTHLHHANGKAVFRCYDDDGSIVGIRNEGELFCFLP